MNKPPLVKTLSGLVIVAVAATILFTWATLTWSYPKGDRVGCVQKFSRKGWICKTWEGELAMVTMPGAVPEKFPFTVRSEQVAAQVNASLGPRS